MPWGYAIAAVGSYLAADKQAGAVEDAANKQAEGTSSALAEQRRQFDLTRADHKPYQDVGQTALWNLEKENNNPLDQSTIQMDPGYEFARKQGQQAIDRQTAASGGRISGAALKAASQYNTDYATTGYSTAYGRANQARTDRLNRLAALAGVGQTATQNVGALGAQNAANTSNLLQTQGNNAGAASLAQGNIWGNTTNQFAALAGKAYDKYNSTPPPKTGSSAGGGDGGEYMSYWQNGGG